MNWAADFRAADFRFVRTTDTYFIGQNSSPYYLAAGQIIIPDCFDPMDTCTITLDNVADTGPNRALLAGYVDTAISTGQFIHFMGHEVKSAAASLTTQISLPDDYDYDIASSTVTVRYPAGMTRQGEPEVLAGKADFAAGGNQVVFTQGNLSAGDPLVVRLSFPPGSFVGAPPAWQTQQEAQNRWSWAWIAAAVATLVGGLAAIFAGMRGFAQTTRKTDLLLHKPPADIPPALAGWLFNQSITWPHGLATLLDLAGRGVVAIDEATEKKWYRSADFLITLLKQPTDARPHERALLDLLFTGRSGAPQDAVKMSDMGRLITSSRWKTYTESLEAEADAQGLISAEAKGRRNRFLVWGVMLLFLALAVLLLTFLFGSMFGFWPFVLAAAVALLGLVAFIAGAAISPLSDRGAKLAETFAPFRRFIEQVSRGKMDVPDPAYYEAHLPYAAAFGYAVPWVKKQVDEGYSAVPAYFHALNADDGSHIAVWLVAVTAATNQTAI